MSKITTMTKTKKAILTAATFLTMIQFGSSNNVHTLPRTDKSRIHLESVQGTGRFYPITYSEGIEDLEKLAEKKEKEDAFVYLPNTGWIDVGFRVNNDKYRTNIDINLVNVVPRGYKYTIRFHFHPLETAPPSVADYNTIETTKKYMDKWFHGCKIISQVVDANKIKWTYGLEALTKEDNQILTYAKNSNEFSDNTHTRKYFSIIKSIFGKSAKESVVEEKPNNNKPKKI